MSRRRSLLRDGSPGCKGKPVALVVLVSSLWLLPTPGAAKGHPANPFGVVSLRMGALGVQPLDGKNARDFALPGMDGKTVRLSDFRGKVVFLNFWATWCPACRVEMPAMETVHRRLRDRGFAVLAVAVDVKGKKTVAPFLKEYGLTFPILLDPKNAVMDRYRVTLIPTTFLIGPRGEFLGKVIGPKEWDGKSATRLFESLLEAAQAPSGVEASRVKP